MSQESVSVPLFIDAAPKEDSVQEDVVRGLSGNPMTLPPKLFYDHRGSQLFDAICELPEYYPTRTETAIMQANIHHMVAAVGPGAALVEYGSGNSQKTEILLSALREPVAYLPIDISKRHLLASADRIARRHPDLRVLPVCADYTTAIGGLAAFTAKHRSVVYFPGSTLGNFEPEAAAQFLTRIARLVGQGGGLLIGIDLRKSPELLRAAYNDAQGVTAAFNLNILRHINRLLGPVFDPGAWRHQALWNDEASRVEMHLFAVRDQTVHVNGTEFQVEAGTSIVTEHSYKFTLEGFQRLASGAGFDTREVWTDLNELFSVHYLTAR